MDEQKHNFHAFKEFYPYYLAEHKNIYCRRLHVVGSTAVILMLLWVVLIQHWVWLWSLPLIGYGFAWIGHCFFEHNKPATFKHPLYSFMGDWVMYWQVLTGKIKF